jgi:N-acetyl-gamma-glutamyl-phosphate reductase
MVTAAIVGASGYGGGELLRILAHHPHIQVKTAVSETYAGKPVSAAFPGMARLSDLTFEGMGDGSHVAACNAVFLAQENGKAMHLAPKLLEAGCKIVDLSADFRFADPKQYEMIYKTPHASPEVNAVAVYGLPEQKREAIRHAQIVGNPGCYPTASTLALLPLLAHIHLDSILIDAKSGVSGAGRAKFGLDYHFAEMNESVSAYKIAGTHRHSPEIEQTLSQAAGQPIALTFTPHLMPMTRGILATCYATLKQSTTADGLRALYREHYADEPFVVVTDDLPATKHTLGSNRCHIGLDVDARLNRVTVIACIDNLIKGAAGQAVQNMNLMLDLPETAGLDTLGGLFP